MKLKNILISAVAFIGLLFVACNSDNEFTAEEGSSDAQIKAFSINAAPYTAIDSITYPALSKTAFSILNQKGNHLIFNTDSLPLNTEIRTLALSIEYTYEPYKTELIYQTTVSPIQDSIVEWNREDSVKFVKLENKYYPRIRTVAYDGKTTRDYTLEFRIHTQDPDSIHWINVENFTLPELGESKVLEDNANGQFHAFIKVGSAIKHYTSPIESPAWSKISDTDLASNSLVKSIYKAEDIFVAIDADGSIYSTSTDNTASWTKGTLTNIAAIIGLLPEIDSEAPQRELLVIYKDETDGSLKYGKTSNFNTLEEVKIKTWGDNCNVPSLFPIKNFTVLTQTIGDKPSLVVSGGLDQEDALVKRSWRISNLSLANETNKAEISVISGRTSNILPDNDNVVSFLYNENKVYTMSTDSLSLYYSYNGDNWQLADKKQGLHKDMKDMRYPSVVVDNADNIWVFGGVSKEGMYSQHIWRGRLNKLTHKK